MDNLEQQVDELEVLNAIYEDKWLWNDTAQSYYIDVTPNVRLYITLNPEYPSSKPPSYELLAPLLNSAQKVKIDEEFQAIHKENLGSPVIFQWIEKLKELVEENDSLVAKPPQNSDQEEFIADVPKKECSIEVTHGSAITDRKSVFQGHCARVDSLEEIREVIDYLKENKKIANATHNISAYRICMPKGSILQDSDDDGENHAGGRVLHLLQILDLKNVLVVVSRWYGGINLGPDRFKHINNAARQVLEQAGFIR